MTKRVLTTQQVAEMLGISPGAVRQKVYRGQLPARKLGERIIFLSDELEKFLEDLPTVVPERWQKKP